MDLFPKIKEFRSEYLTVDEVHQLYIEQSGNPNGIPVVFLHGGPGAGTSEVYRRFFNPELYRIILFDQRGSGRSKPFSSIVNNTTEDLINDVKKIFNHLNINKAIIYGGSWGSTLGLLFAEKFPDLVYSLVLRGIFLCRKSDINWFYQKGADAIYPEYWDRFISDIPLAERDNILQAYHNRIHGTDNTKSLKSCKKWAEWEGRCATLLPSKNVIDNYSDCSESLSKIETHYFFNNCFIKENQIIKNINKLTNIKCYIIHGRYDIVCPFSQAYDLHEVYKRSELNIINDAGHSLLEPGITKKVLEIFSNPNALIS
ncbi:MAG: prolyl aminopeptidase [Gammaproteobacteria bacterium]|nr:prolyl aminopeptidase [Gammaproteobacteria bacterium]